VIFKFCLSSRQGTKTKQKVRIDNCIAWSDLSRAVDSLWCHLVIFKLCLSSRQGTKTKQKVRIYDRLLKMHGDKDEDIIKN
jgi:hypothetical protein